MDLINGVFWRGVSIALGAILLGLGLFGGSKIYLLSRDLGKASQRLQDEQRINAGLQIQIGNQNAAISDWKSKSDLAQERYQAALQASEETGKKVDTLSRSLGKLKKGVTCQDAMPAVNMALEGLR